VTPVKRKVDALIITYTCKTYRDPSGALAPSVPIFASSLMVYCPG